MVKKLFISLTIVLLISLIVVNLNGEKDIIHINTLNEVDLVEEIPYFDAIDYVQLDENDKVYNMRYYTEASYLSTDRRNFIYRVNIKNNRIDLLKEIPKEYAEVTALYYSNKDKKIYMGAYGEIPYGDEMPSSYLIRFNTDMEIEQSVRIKYEISNFFEVGDKIYAECNSEHERRRLYMENTTNIRTMHEIDKNNFDLKKYEGSYIFFESYKMENGNIVIIKASDENVKRLMEKKGGIDVIVEMIDNKGVVLSINEVKSVYPNNIDFVELPNGNVVFNLEKGQGYNPKDQVYIYAKDGDGYSLSHKDKVKLPYGYYYSGVVKDKNNIGILVNQIDPSEGKNEIWMFDENIEKLIKKYEVDNSDEYTTTWRVEIDGDKNKLFQQNGTSFRIGEINFSK